MAKVELGFSGERFIYLPIPMIHQIEDSPLTGDLYIYSLGYFSKASHHYINRPEGCDEFLFIYCKAGIAHKLGFSESQYFSRVFSHIMGMSALEFRKQNSRP